MSEVWNNVSMGAAPSKFGPIDASLGAASPQIGPIGDPTSAQDAATKGYADNSGQRSCRNVVYANVNIAAYPVAADAAVNDNVLNVAPDAVFLAAQTVPSQNGPWVVGTVVAGLAVLTRPNWYQNGSLLAMSMTIAIGPEGANFGSSTWRSFAAVTVSSPKVVGTDSPLFWPRQQKFQVVLSAGTYKIGFGSTANPDEPLFLASVTGSVVAPSMNTSGTAGGAPTLTTEYGCPNATRVAGVAGVGILVVNAQVAAGTLNNADTSTLDVLVTNWT